MTSRIYLKCAVIGTVLTVSVAGCAYGIKARSAYDKRVDFATYNTFFMLNGNSTGDPVVDERLASDVRSTLMAKGWLQVPEGDGKTAVVIHTATSAAHTSEAFYRGWGGWDWRTNRFNEPARIPDDYDVGTVIVTIFDANSKQAIWRGFATKAIAPDRKNAAKIREAAVARIFQEFPPAQ